MNGFMSAGANKHEPKAATLKGLKGFGSSSGQAGRMWQQRDDTGLHHIHTLPPVRGSE